MYLNKVILIGNLTRDPELRSLPTGAKVCSFSIATNRYWTDRQTNQRKEDVEYHNITVFGYQADNCAKYLQKGQQVMLEGRLRTTSWDGNDGKKRYRTEIVAENVQFGQKRSGGGSQGGNNSESLPEINSPSDNSNQSIDTIDYPDEDTNPEDIPF